MNFLFRTLALVKCVHRNAQRANDDVVVGCAGTRRGQSASVLIRRSASCELRVRRGPPVSAGSWQLAAPFVRMRSVYPLVSR
jgi:hypothetical protein